MGSNISCYDAISPIDGRYREKVKILADYFQNILL